MKSFVESGAVSLFQFHIGSIKNSQRWNGLMRWKRFQFHIGDFRPKSRKASIRSFSLSEWDRIWLFYNFRDVDYFDRFMEFVSSHKVNILPSHRRNLFDNLNFFRQVVFFFFFDECRKKRQVVKKDAIGQQLRRFIPGCFARIRFWNVIWSSRYEVLDLSGIFIGSGKTRKV